MRGAFFDTIAQFFKKRRGCRSFHLRCSRETEPSLCDWKSSQYGTLKEHHKEKRKTKQWQIDSETDHQYSQSVGKPWASQWYRCPKNSFRAATPPKDDGADANENQTHRGTQAYQLIEPTKEMAFVSGNSCTHESIHPWVLIKVHTLKDCPCDGVESEVHTMRAVLRVRLYRPWPLAVHGRRDQHRKFKIQRGHRGDHLIQRSIRVFGYRPHIHVGHIVPS